MKILGFAVQTDKGVSMHT